MKTRHLCARITANILVGVTTLMIGTVMLDSCKENGRDSAARVEEGPAFIGPADTVAGNGSMSPEVLLSLGRISDPQISPSGSLILYGVSYTSIEDNRSCRNLRLCASDGSDDKLITHEGKSISNARWSPDGSYIYFIQDGQVWKSHVGTEQLGKFVRVTDVPNGVSGFSLSPDGSKILYISTVPGPVKTPSDFGDDLGKASAYVTEDLMYRHWDHWVTEIPQAYVAALDAMVTEENSTNLLDSEAGLYELPLEPFGGIEQFSWSPDGRYIIYSCKKLTGKEYAFSTDTELYIYSVEFGSSLRVPLGGGYDTDPVWSPDGRHIAWLRMERNGYEADKTRLMTMEFSSEGNQYTFGNFIDHTKNFKYNAGGICWSDNSAFIYFDALAEGLQGIFRLDVEGGKDEIVRITDDNIWCDFQTPFAAFGNVILTSFCSMDFPAELVIIQAGEGEPVKRSRGDYLVTDPVTGHKMPLDGHIVADCPVIEGASVFPLTHENAHILDSIFSHETQAHYIRTVDGKDMLTWVLLPPQFDATREYPAIEICLGGPQGTLSQGWSYRWNYRLMAAQDYVVILPNRRGTTAFGQEWCEQISGDYVGLNMQDYMKAGREMKAAPYVGKLAACGASYGGFSVYYLAGVHGDLYDCFIAHAGIFDEEYMYYETEEMWFPNWDNGGLTEYAYESGQVGPKGDGKTFGGMQQAGSPWSSSPKARRHYANSPSTKVTAWHTPILCIHGGMDFRIPYDQGMAAFNAAQMMGVPSKLIVFPDECHWILKPQNALFWHRSYFEWLDRWCKDGGNA